MGNGDSYERAFVRLFTPNTLAWQAQRAAASGSATTAELPDVTFAYEGVAFAGELKTVSSDTKYIYIGDDEMEKLQDYAAAYGMRAVALGRWKGERAYYLWNPNEMHRTDAGTYRGSRGDTAWSAKIAEPDGSADGLYPSELSGRRLARALAADSGEQLTELAGSAVVADD